jgi:hypothetical protein
MSPEKKTYLEERVFLKVLGLKTRHLTPSSFG